MPPRAHPGRRRLRRVLSGFFLRFHMTLILLATCAAGALVNHALFSFGMHARAWRWPVGTLLAYGVFFGCVWLWLGYVRASLSGRTSGGDALEAGLDGLDVSLDVAGGADVDVDLGLDLDEGGVVLVLAMLVAALLLGGALYLVWTGPALLTEAAFEMALAAGLVRPARRLQSGHWVKSLLRGTAIPFLLTLALALGAGLLVSSWCPSAERVRDVLACE